MRDSKPNLEIKSSANLRVGIIKAKWNEHYNDQMLASAQNALLEAGTATHNIKVFEVPGAFEIPVFALHLAQSKNFDVIICLATIIKGATYHFDIVANESARGIMDVALKTGVPVINGILACNNAKQAELRASAKKEDKGREIALSAISLINSLNSLTIS